MREIKKLAPHGAFQEWRRALRPVGVVTHGMAGDAREKSRFEFSGGSKFQDVSRLITRLMTKRTETNIEGVRAITALLFWTRNRRCCRLPTSACFGRGLFMEIGIGELVLCTRNIRNIGVKTAPPLLDRGFSQLSVCPRKPRDKTNRNEH